MDSGQSFQEFLHAARKNLSIKVRNFICFSIDSIIVNLLLSLLNFYPFPEFVMDYNAIHILSIQWISHPPLQCYSEVLYGYWRKFFCFQYWQCYTDVGISRVQKRAPSPKSDAHKTMWWQRFLSTDRSAGDAGHRRWKEIEMNMSSR